MSFLGPHTGDIIKTTVDTVLTEFDLVAKVNFIISDNASNVVKAFQIALPGTEELGLDTIEEVGSDDEWDENGLDVPDDLTIDGDLVAHLRCFAHSLQLVVRDGMKQTKGFTTLLRKCCKLASMLHISTKFKVIVLSCYGIELIIPNKLLMII